MHRQLVFQRQFFQGVNGPADFFLVGVIGGHAHRHHVFFARQQFFQHRAPERLLSVNDDSHARFSA